MASIIRIKRSSVSGNPSTLGAGELAYSALADNGSNGGDRLYIGMGAETAGNAASHVVIGGKFFTDMVSAATNLNTASTLVKRDASGNFVAGTITATLTGNADTATKLATARTIAFTGDATASGSFDGSANYSQAITLATVNSNVGQFGSATAIPIITVNGKGLVTAVSTANIATTLNITGDTGSDGISLLSETLGFVGGTGITSSVTANTVTFDIDSTVATLTGSQTLTNKTISGASNTLSNIGNSSLVNSSVTFGTTTVALGSSSTTIAGLTQVDVGNVRVTGNTISSTNTNGNIVLDPNGTGTVDVSSSRITNLAEPVADSDAATKYYVDAARSGLDVKQSVRVATTENITLSNTQTIDGIALSVGDRVLVKDQNTGSQNGIYVVADGAWTRATDFDAPNEVTSGVFTFVEQGTVNSDCGFVLTTDGTVVVGTTALSFTLFSASGTLIAGNGLSKNGYTLEVNVAPLGGIEISSDNLQLKSTVAGNGLTITDGVLNVGGTTNRITITSDGVDIASTYAGQSSISVLGTVLTGTWNADIISPTFGGTGVNNGSKTITLGGNLTTAGNYATTLTMTGATSVTLPTTGTLATLAGTESLSNKTITASSFAGSVTATTLSASGLVTFTNTTDAGPLGTAGVVMSGGLSVAKKVYVGTDIIGSGAADSNIDGFNIDGGTY
jgi:hypothetical protein